MFPGILQSLSIGSTGGIDWIDMIERLAYVGLRTQPMPYRFLRMAEVGG